MQSTLLIMGLKCLRRIFLKTKWNISATTDSYTLQAEKFIIKDMDKLF